MISVVLADDHEILRQGLVQLLRTLEDVEVLAEVSDGDQLLAEVTSRRPDVAVVDVSMPGPGVLGICQAIRERGLATKVVVLTMHQSADIARQLLGGGAAAYVLKKSALAELQTAIRSVVAGSSYVSPSLAAEVITSPDRAVRMTERELDVIRLIAQGNTNQRIARQLSISEKTVQTHRARAMEKLGVHSGPELVRRAIEIGLLNLE